MSTNIRTGRLLHAFLTLIIFFSIPFTSMNARTTSGGRHSGPQVPDFAYPETVAKNADESYTKALSTGNSSLLLQSLIDYVTAERLITRDNTQLCIDRLVQAREHSSEPEVKSMIDLMQATVLYRYYQADSYTLDRRELPLTPVPADLAQWSGQQLRDSVCSLISSAVSREEALRKAPISVFGKTINYDRLQSIYYPTLFDFAGARACEILYGIDSYPEAKALLASVRGVLLDTHKPGSAPFINYTVENLQRTYDPSEIFSLYDKYADIEYSGQFLTLINPNLMTIAEKKIYLGTVRSFMKKYPRYWQNNTLSNHLAWMLAESAVVDFPASAVVAPGVPFDINITVSNAQSAEIRFYLVNESTALNGIGRYTIKGLKPEKALKVTCDSVAPFKMRHTVQATLDREGLYAVSISTPHSDQEISYKPLQCSSFMGVMVTNGLSQKDYLLAVNTVTGMPESSVKAEFRKSLWRNGRNIKSTIDLGTSDAEGLVTLLHSESASGEFILSRGKSRFISANSYISAPPVEPHGETYSAYGYTSLGVYRPGDEADFAFAVSRNKDGAVAPAADMKCRAILFDANYQKLDTLLVSTDAYGRAQGRFTLPKDLLQGNFSIRLCSASDTEYDVYGSTQFMVSDYKMPQFRVEVTAVRHDYPSKGDVTIDGKALTYTDFPVADAKVSVGLRTCTRLRWWYGAPDRQITSEQGVTSADGLFSFTFADSLLRNAGSDAFEANIDVTSPTGETRSCTRNFTQGKPYYIALGDMSAIDISKKFVIPVTVNNEEYKPVSDVRMTYSLTPVGSSDVRYKGTFTSADPSIDLSSCAQGEYTISIQTADTTLADAVTTMVILYNPHATASAVPYALWLPSSSARFSDGKAEVLYAVGADEARIYSFISDSEGNSRIEQWTAPSGYGTYSLSPLDPSAETTWVTLLTVRNGKTTEYTATIDNPQASRAISVQVESFRDHLLPGENETWTFRTTDAHGKPVESALMLDVYNLALDQICGHSFGKPGFYIPARGSSYSVNDLNNGFIHLSCNSDYRTLEETDLTAPDFNTYGLDFGFSPRFFGYARNARMMKSATVLQTEAVVTEDAAEYDMAVPVSAANASPASGAEDSAAGEVEEAGAQETNNNYRPVEMPLMMFRPMLATDASGRQTVSFTVPDANATWRLAIVAFTKKLQTAGLQKDFITSKPLMVASNAPRFLRAGDEAVIETSVMNATDTALTAKVTVEIFNPLTGIISKTESFEVEIAAQSASKVSAKVSASPDESAVGYRVRASSGRFTDGEQQAVPVLPSLEPVTESLPFYLSPETRSFELKIPEVPADAAVSLQYCDNPRWLVVSALPGLLDDIGSNANSAAVAIYSASVAAGIIKDRPEIAQAIREWQSNPSDSALVSMLERNSQLKTTLLQATPWVREAESDTERMARLSLLFDKKAIADNFDKALATLTKLYSESGGWMWFEQAREASVWTTRNVLGMMGDLRRLGYLKKSDKLDRMIRGSVEWLDRESVKEWRKIKSASAFAEYVFVRDMFADVPMKSEAEQLTGAVVQYIVGNWRSYALGEKPMAAMILWHHGYKELASQILESMRQFSKYTPERGMWFPSFDDSKPWWNMSKNIATALALEAFAAIEPKSADSEHLAQWLIMQKEAQNWGTSVATTQVISALLNSSGMSMQPAGVTGFSIGRKHLEPSRAERLTGSFVMPIGQYSPSGKTLKIKRDDDASTQAFGAVIMRFKADPRKVSAASCQDVSISKRLLRRVSTPEGYVWNEATELNVGDRVKTLLTVTVNRDMEYVVITDERAAAFEPVDQIPGYEYSEGTAFYRENSDASTRYFISYLPKGTYMLSYELNVNNAGIFTSGLATLQSQYAPALTAHSSGTCFEIR